jgi:hypothetical protein
MRRVCNGNYVTLSLDLMEALGYSSVGVWRVVSVDEGFWESVVRDM